MKIILSFVCVALFLTAASFAHAQGESPYTEGSVWGITMVKTKYGLEDDYLKGLKTTLVTAMEEAKKEGLVLSYKMFVGEAATPQDFNILLMTEFKNFAAFDGMREKFDAIDKKIASTADQQREMAIKRLEIREIMGMKTMREVTLK